MKIDFSIKRIFRLYLAVCIFTFLAYQVIPVKPIPEGVHFYNPSIMEIVKGETIIYDTITPYNNSIIQIDDLTNIKYLDEYKYSVYINDRFLGEYSKGDKIEVSDNSSITIVVPANIKQKLDSNSFTQMIGVGFYGFMQYGIYVILLIIIILYITKRRR